MIGRSLCKTLLLAACVLGCAAVAPALASAAGAIEGTVIEAGTSPEVPIEGIQVCAFERGGGSDGGCQSTDAEGEYTIEELPEGEYGVLFSGTSCTAGGCVTGWGEQLFDGLYANEEPTWVHVEEGRTTRGIDAALGALGGISGTIESAAGGGIANTVVCVDSTTQYYNGCARTDETGAYEFGGLPPGEFDIEFTGWVCDAEGSECTKEACETMTTTCTHPYVAQYYLEHPIFNPEELQTVAVESRQTTAGVDATLTPGGTIEGTVSLAAVGEPPLAGIHVCASSEVDMVEARCTTTDANGEYALEGLASSSSWQVEFSEACPEETCPGTYVTQYFDDKAEAAEATRIEVSAPATVAGVDATMVERSPSRPVFTGDPVLSGRPLIGGTLRCSEGKWSNSPTSIEYTWLRDGTPIAGQGGSTYVVTAEDEGASLACQVTLANEVGSVSAISNTLSVPFRWSRTPIVVTLQPSEPQRGRATARGKATAKGKATTHHSVTVRITCTGQGACKGKLTLVYKHKTKNGRGRTKVTKTVIGTASFTIAAGKSKAVVLTLNAKGERYLEQAGRQGLKARLIGSGVKLRTMVVLKPTIRPEHG